MSYNKVDYFSAEGITIKRMRILEDFHKCKAKYGKCIKNPSECPDVWSREFYVSLSEYMSCAVNFECERYKAEK